MFGAEVAWVMRSEAARGEFADLASARKGARALRARDWSIVRVLLPVVEWGGVVVQCLACMACNGWMSSFSLYVSGQVVAFCQVECLVLIVR